jgi:hypothetical protein
VSTTGTEDKSRPGMEAATAAETGGAVAPIGKDAMMAAALGPGAGLGAAPPG